MIGNDQETTEHVFLSINKLSFRGELLFQIKVVIVPLNEIAHCSIECHKFHHRHQMQVANGASLDIGAFPRVQSPTGKKFLRNKIQNYVFWIQRCDDKTCIAISCLFTTISKPHITLLTIPCHVGFKPVNPFSQGNQGLTLALQVTLT